MLSRRPWAGVAFVAAGLWLLFLISPGFAAQPGRGDYVFVIDKYECTLTVHRASETGPVERTFRVSVGRNPDLQDKKAKGDFRTPEGRFTIQSIHPATTWLHNGVRAYGPWFVRLKTPGWSGIGIHGTNEGDKLGTPASDGCIRLATEEIRLLREKYVAIGGSVIVRRGTPPGWKPPVKTPPAPVPRERGSVEARPEALPADGSRSRTR